MSSTDNSPSPVTDYPRGPHVFAVLLLLATFVLIVSGGNVTSKGAGLVSLDNSQSFNPADWAGIPFVRDEYAHRVVGGTLGVLVVILAVWLRQSETRPSVRWLGVIACIAVAAQGAMGWLRISQMSVALAVFHGCFAHAFLCLALTLAVMTSPGWRRWQEQPGLDPWLKRTSVFLVLALFMQLVVGAILRHTGSGLPAHIAGALVVGACLLLVSQRALTLPGGEGAFRNPVTALFMLFGAEVTLGATALLAIHAMETAVPQTRTQAYLPTVHVAIGAVMIAISFYLVLRVHATGHLAKAGESGESPVGADDAAGSSAEPEA